MKPFKNAEESLIKSGHKEQHGASNKVEKNGPPVVQIKKIEEEKSNHNLIKIIKKNLFLS